MIALLAGIGLAIVAGIAMGGCATPLEREARQIEERTYELSLRRQVQSHIYSMSCMALLPLAADYLWERGYGDSKWIGDREGLISEWKKEEGGAGSQYEIHAQELGPQQCTIQALRRREAKESLERDPRWEWRFLQAVNPEQAGRLDFRAQEEADGAYREVMERYGER